MWNKFTQLTVSWRWHILWPREVVVCQELLDCSFSKLHPVLSPTSFSTAVSPTSASPFWLISGVWIPLWLCCHERDFSYLVLKSNPWPEKAKGEKNPNQYHEMRWLQWQTEYLIPYKEWVLTDWKLHPEALEAGEITDREGRAVF